jgi:hypothetical protein
VPQKLISLGTMRRRKSKTGKGVYVLYLQIDTVEVCASSSHGPTKILNVCAGFGGFLRSSTTIEMKHLKSRI